MKELKQCPTNRVFCAWNEDWEKELLQQNDCVAKEKLLAKCQNLVFFDPNNDAACTVHSGGMEFHWRDRKRNIDKGWAVIAIDNKGETEGFAIGDMLVDLIAETKQAPGVEIVRK